MKKVLFVCMSNSRRSQMAETIFSRLSETKAKSAGIDPAGGDYKVDENVIIVLKEIGIDVHNPKAKKVTKPMLEEADKIITFMCAEKIPEKYKSKVEDWALGVKRELGQKQSERTIDEIRKLRDLIYEKVEELVEGLKNEEQTK